MPSAKYVIVTNSFPPETFSIALVAGQDAPTKANNDAIRDKVEQMISAGKMVKGTLGTKAHPDLPGGPNYMENKSGQFESMGRKVNYTDRIRPWATNILYSYDAEKDSVIVDYPHLRVIPEDWKGLRVLKAEHAQEWIDWCLAFGATNAAIISEEEVLAIAPEMELPDDSNIDTHVEGSTP